MRRIANRIDIEIMACNVILILLVIFSQGIPPVARVILVVDFILLDILYLVMRFIYKNNEEKANQNKILKGIYYFTLALGLVGVLYFVLFN